MSIVTNPFEEINIRTTVDCCGPANQVRPQSKKHDNLAVSIWPGMEATIHVPAVGTANPESSRRSSDTVGKRSILFCQLLACWPSFWTTAENLIVSGCLNFWSCADVYGPHDTANSEKILRILDFLVTKEFGPGTVGGIAEAVGQVARRVPPAGGLRRILPQVRETPVGVAKCNHVAGDDIRA